MPIKYKIDVLAALKEKGFSTFRIRKEKIMNEGALQAIRENRLVSADNLSKLCKLLECQPGDILEYVPEGKGSASTD